MTTTANGLHSTVFRQFKNGAWRDFEDVVTPEERIVLHWPGRAPKVLLAFPEDREHLALGHAMLEFCEPEQHPRLVGREGRDFFLEPIPAQPMQGQAGFPPLHPETVLERMGEFIEAGGRWDETGCFHRAALFDPAGRAFIRQVEDIGRHNCLDRAVGHCLERGLSTRGLAVFVSARATGSLVAKAVAAGFPLLVSRSAVTMAGLETARDAGMSLLGFARQIRFTVFTDQAGLILDPGGNTASDKGDGT